VLKKLRSAKEASGDRRDGVTAADPNFRLLSSSIIKLLSGGVFDFALGLKGENRHEHFSDYFLAAPWRKKVEFEGTVPGSANLFVADEASSMTGRFRWEVTRCFRRHHCWRKPCGTLVPERRTEFRDKV
jgi:hypothetical protein